MKSTMLLGAAALGLLASGAMAATLDDVRARGTLNCGVNTGLTGFAAPNAEGVWEGFDVDLCRAVAAAVLGDPEAINFVPVNSEIRFTSLASGEIDVLIRNTTWSYQRDTELAFDVPVVNYYDGQGFLAPRELGVASATELDGANVCIQTGTTTELNLADFFRSNNLTYQPVPVANDDEAQQQFLAGACDVYTTDASGLAAVRATLANPDDFVILPEIISKEPLGPLVRHGDNAWGDIIRWTYFALITAEEFGITQANVAEMAAAPGTNPEVNRLLGTEDNYGAFMGLEPDWAVRAISAGGNYAEIFERNLGSGTPIGLARGLNALYRDGGLQYAPPFR